MTVPAPLPARETVKLNTCKVNVAVTDVAALTVTTQVPVPLQPPPDQPVKLEPADGAAVKVTTLPKLYGEVQVTPQLMPAGAEVTVPAPLPAGATVKLNNCKVNVAVTDVAALTVTTQVPVPLQPPPDQPVKLEPADGAAVKVTTLPKL